MKTMVDPVVLPGQAQQAVALVRGTPANQQDLPDDTDSVDFAFEAFDAATGAVQPAQASPEIVTAPSQVEATPPVQQQTPAQGTPPEPQPGEEPLEFQLFSDSEERVPEPAVEQPVAGQQQQPAVVSQAPAVAPQPVAAPAAVAPAAVPAAQPISSGPVDPFEFAAQQIAAQEQAFTQQLAEKAYPVSEEDLQAFLGGDGKKMSQFAARVHVNVMASVMKVISQQAPVLFHGLIQAHKLNSEAENAYWETNKFLNRRDKAHRDATAMATRAFRQANPNADEAMTNKMVGLMAAAAVGVDPAATFAQRGSAAPQVRTPGPVVKQTSPGFQPAAPQGVNGRAAPQYQSEWDLTSRIIQAEESGAFDSRR